MTAGLTMKFRKLIFVLLIIGVVILIPVINKNINRSEERVVDVANLSERVIRPSILASGNLTHDEEVRLSS